MEGPWILAIVILVILAILCGIMIYLKFFKRRTIIKIIAGRIRRLQDVAAKLNEELESREIELELRKMEEELKKSIVSTEAKILKLKSG